MSEEPLYSKALRDLLSPYTSPLFSLSSSPSPIPSNGQKRERILIESMTLDRELMASRGLEIKDLRDLKDLTIHHVKPSWEQVGSSLSLSLIGPCLQLGSFDEFGRDP